MDAYQGWALREVYVTDRERVCVTCYAGAFASYLPTQQGAWRWRSSGRTGWGEAPWLINCYSACADVGHLEEPLEVPKYLVQSDISTWGDARCILPWPYTAGRWSRVWVAAVTLWLRAGLAPLVVW